MLIYTQSLPGPNPHEKETYEMLQSSSSFPQIKGQCLAKKYMSCSIYLSCGMYCASNMGKLFLKMRVGVSDIACECVWGRGSKGEVAILKSLFAYCIFISQEVTFLIVHVMVIFIGIHNFFLLIIL